MKSKKSKTISIPKMNIRKKNSDNILERILSHADSHCSKLNSPAGRKVILLTLIGFALFLDLAIFGWGKIISQTADNANKTDPVLVQQRENIHSLVKGYPIDRMSYYISMHDKKTAAFLVSIAKQESDWGNHVPVLNGKDCYNYWGFRLESSKMTQDGYTCFDNSAQAVNVVSQRLSQLINKSGLDTPRTMVVWKCGSDCSGFPPEDVNSWINNVNYYFKKFY